MNKETVVQAVTITKATSALHMQKSHEHARNINENSFLKRAYDNMKE